MRVRYILRIINLDSMNHLAKEFMINLQTKSARESHKELKELKIKITI